MRNYYQFKKLSDFDLKYRMEFHKRKYIYRDNAISILMGIEKQKEIEYSKWKCLFCQLVKSSCICAKRRYVE